MEALGISIPGLMRNRWKIEGGAAPEAKNPKTTATVAGGSVRDRPGLKVVAGGQAA